MFQHHLKNARGVKERTIVYFVFYQHICSFMSKHVYVKSNQIHQNEKLKTFYQRLLNTTYITGLLNNNEECVAQYMLYVSL